MVNTEFASYFVHIIFEQEEKRYQLLVYDDIPEARFFGVKFTRNPIINRKFDIRVDPEEKTIELIQEYELPLIYKKKMDLWDGIIPSMVEAKEKEKQNLPEPVKPVQEEEEGYEPIRIPITHWQDKVG